MEKIRVLHILANLHLGGIETTVMNFYRHVDKSLIQFDFLINDDGISNHHFEQEAKSMGARVYRMPKYSRRSLTKSIKSLLWLYNLMKNDKEIKVVHVHRRPLGAAMMVLMARLAGIKIRIVHSHSAPDNRPLIDKLVRPIIRRLSTYWVAVSSASGQVLYGEKQWQKSKKAILIFNAIDLNLFKFSIEKRKETRATLGLTDEKAIMHVSRLDPVKNQAFLLEAFAQALKKEHNLKLFIIGDGPLGSQLKKQAIELGIEKNANFLGARSDIADLLNAADLFVFPSFHEGLGIVGIEAQATGLPTLLSNTIPIEIIATQLATRLPIDKGIEVWSRHMAQTPPIIAEVRATSTEVVSQAGYDIKEVAKKLTALYQSERG